MRRTICVIVLLASLTGSAYAGEMPQPVASSSEAAVQGEIGQPLTEIITAVLKTVLSLI